MSPATGSPLRCRPRNRSRCKSNVANDERQQRRLAAEQPQAHAPTPPARGCMRDYDRRANESANINANAGGDAPLLFRRVSHNLAAAAMLLHGCPEAATSEERRVHQ
jgi:hypothetical protein